jgi:protein SCO1
MRRHILFILALALLSSTCSKRDQRTYAMQGQVLSIEAPGKRLVVKHEDIKGLMPAMTMPYAVKDEHLLDGLAAGDLIDATLVVVSNDAFLTAIRKVGQAPLEKAPPEAPMPTASSGFELLKPGEAVPNGSFLDQDGKKRSFSAFKGSRIVMTFIYTTCPLPTFCPLMDRHFVAIQKSLQENPALKDVHLVTVSFDPKTDTPPVLTKHARELRADLTRWTFLTGDRDEVDQFAARFGVSVARAQNDPRDITHNLRTAIVDPDGRLVKVYVGNEWSPDQILADLEPIARAN